MNSALEDKLLKNGYVGNICDLVYYAGSEEGLAWYWENYLEKILLKAKGFYSGAFIRYKVKSEAKLKYTQYLIKLNQAKLKEAKTALRKVSEEIKAQMSEISLNEWFIKYNNETDIEARRKSFELFVNESGYFDFLSKQEKEKKVEEFLEQKVPLYPYCGLFRIFITEHIEVTP